MMNMFQKKASISDDLKDILEEVVSVKKVCMSSRASVLDMLQNKEFYELFVDCSNELYWSFGNQLTNAN